MNDKALIVINQKKTENEKENNINEKTNINEEKREKREKIKEILNTRPKRMYNYNGSLMPISDGFLPHIIY